jgi:hypothetical protein
MVLMHIRTTRAKTETMAYRRHRVLLLFLDTAQRFLPLTLGLSRVFEIDQTRRFYTVKPKGSYFER